MEKIQVHVKVQKPGQTIGTEGEEGMCCHSTFDDRSLCDVPMTPRDDWWCRACYSSPCRFLQLQPELTQLAEAIQNWFGYKNNGIRKKLYQHLSVWLYGPSSKGTIWNLPRCFISGVKELYPEEDMMNYVGCNSSQGGWRLETLSPDK